MVVREGEEIPSWSPVSEVRFSQSRVCENMADVVESQMIGSAGENCCGSLLPCVICVTVFQRERN